MNDDNDKNPPGRPSKLTPVVADGIVAAIKAGSFIDIAARSVGISRRTIRRWMATGKKYPDGVYGQLRKRVIEATASCEVDLITAISNSTDWRALAWVAERRFADRWAMPKLLLQLANLEKQLAEIRNTANYMEWHQKAQADEDKGDKDRKESYPGRDHYMN